MLSFNIGDIGNVDQGYVMSNLRNEIIKLAWNNPGKVRNALLPILQKTSRDYKEYEEEKKRKGEKPLSRKEWEARQNGKGEEKGKEKEKGKGEDSGDGDWKAQIKTVQDTMKSLPSRSEVGKLVGDFEDQLEVMQDYGGMDVPSSVPPFETLNSLASTHLTGDSSARSVAQTEAKIKYFSNSLKEFTKHEAWKGAPETLRKKIDGLKKDLDKINDNLQKFKKSTWPSGHPDFQKKW